LSKKETFYFLPGENQRKKTSLLDEFSLPLYRRRDDHDFFFLGDDDELVTGAVAGVSAREVFNRVFSRIS